MSDPSQSGKRLRAMVLGGYGLIGSACLRALQDAGFDVTGVGRSKDAAARAAPDATWIIRDIGHATAEDWRADLEGVDVIVNATGALQDGARDNLRAIHEDAIAALIEAIGDKSIRFIQISAAGANTDAAQPFFATKGRGDAALMASPLNYTILRPTLVMGRTAYGGTAMLRAAAATPLMGFSVLGDTRIMTVALSDLTDAVVKAAKGETTPRTCADLTAPEVMTFAEVTQKIRRWLGFAPWRLTLPLPNVAMRLIGKGADALGWLGWRSPLRSTTLDVLKDGLHADPTQWEAAGGSPCKSLDATLRDMPAGVQDRWFARLFLALPLAIGTLSLFWLLSGLIGLFQAEAAQQVLLDRAVSPGLAAASVYLGAVLDITLGIAVLFRRHARAACLGMIALSLAYLAGGTLVTPDLWADPLGPFVKVLPAMVLAAITTALLDDR